MERKTAALLTLGCRLNQADTALLCDRLKRMGFEIVPVDSPRSPNLIIVNSCTVTASAFKKSKQSLRAVRAENPQSFIVLTGCAADVDAEKLSSCDDCDLLLPNESKKDIERILPRYLASLSRNSEIPSLAGAVENGVYHENALSVFPFRSRAILKIQEGCNQCCTYCVVPRARGRERSRDLEETLRDFRNFVDSGFQEIVLSGVHLCSYRSGSTDLAGLLERLVAMEGNFRIRIGSTEPGPMVAHLLKVMAKYPDRICPFLHMPLQNGSDRILRAMGRRCLTAEYADYVDQARSLLPRIHIGSDIIIGFPGETEQDFADSFQFLEKTAFANLHVFPFSPREGTPAAEKKDSCPPPAVLADRIERMKKLREQSMRRYAESLLGSEEYVLPETKRAPGVWEGWSGNYVKTRIRSRTPLAKKLLRIRFVSFGADGVLEALPLPSPAEEKTGKL